MSQIFKISGKVRDYNWGGYEFISSILGNPINSETPVPQAEYWLGAHLSAPSIAMTGKYKGQSIPEIIASNKELILGSKIVERFGELPFLFKILDVKDMLSIQVHPSKESAEAGFAAENKAGVPVDAPHRNYRDDNHKPELMLALSDFWLLHGFKSEDSIRELLKTREIYQPMLKVLDESGVKGLFEWTLSEVDVTRSVSDPLLAELRDEKMDTSSSDLKSSPEYWIYKWTRDPKATHRGLLVILLMNVVNIPKGEAIFQSAGIIHAYLEGQNIEIMANSDNVLRGGLTEKHMDFDELIKHTKFETIDPADSMIPATVVNEFERCFDAPIEDFILSEINLLPETTTTCLSEGLEVFLVFSGSVSVSGSAEEVIHFAKGEAFAVTNEAEVTIKSNDASSGARVFRAKAHL